MSGDFDVELENVGGVGNLVLEIINESANIGMIKRFVAVVVFLDFHGNIENVATVFVCVEVKTFFDFVKEESCATECGENDGGDFCFGNVRVTVFEFDVELCDATSIITTDDGIDDVNFVHFNNS